MKLIIILFIASYFQSLFAATPLNSTVMIFNDNDLSQCQEAIQKAYDMNNDRVHLVPTIYASLDNRKVIKYLYRDNHGKLQNFHHEYLKRFQNQLLSCVEYAHELKMQIYITPHVDDAAPKGKMRYYIDYSPTKKYQRFSFAQIMFDYLNKLDKNIQKRVYLSLIGETDLSVYHYSNDYKKVIKSLSPALKLGLSFSLLQSQPGLPHFRKLSFIDQLDFLGVSAYNAIKYNCTSNSFEKIAQKFWRNMRKMGMTKRLRLHFTEVGLGGSLKGSFYTALLPILGQSGKYQISNDPWQIDSNYQYRKNYYKCLLDFLEKTPTIQAAFLWNSDSWDVQGLYHYSSDYRDETISEWISNHNDKAKK